MVRIRNLCNNYVFAKIMVKLIAMRYNGPTPTSFNEPRDTYYKDTPILASLHFWVFMKPQNSKLANNVHSVCTFRTMYSVQCKRWPENDILINTLILISLDLCLFQLSEHNQAKTQLGGCRSFMWTHSGWCWWSRFLWWNRVVKRSDLGGI